MLRVCRRGDESLHEWKRRIFENRRVYGLSWDEVNDILDLDLHPDTTRIRSKGYIDALDDIKVGDNDGFDRNILIINDPHLPYEREDLIDVISKHANEIDTLVFGGDLMDCESVSSFPKIRGRSLQDELIYAYNFMKRVRGILNKGQKIIMIKGNHEERLYKEICKMHQKDLQSMINPDILDMLVEGFTIYQDGKKKRFEGLEGVFYIPSWYVNLDDKVIVCHPKGFSQVKGKMLEKTVSYFLNQHEDFEAIVFGHTHKFSTGIVDRYQNIYAVENGCMCKPMEYANSGKLGYTKQSYCYTMIRYNKDERIDYNDIKVHHLKEIYDTSSKCKINLD